MEAGPELRVTFFFTKDEWRILPGQISVLEAVAIDRLDDGDSDLTSAAGADLRFVRRFRGQVKLALGSEHVARIIGEEYGQWPDDDTAAP